MLGCPSSLELIEAAVQVQKEFEIFKSHYWFIYLSPDYKTYVDNGLCLQWSKFMPGKINLILVEFQ